MELFEQVLESPTASAYRVYALAGQAQAWEDLGRYDEAADQWRAILDRYPTHRLVPMARARLEALAEGRMAGDEPLRRYRYVLRHYATLPHEQALHEMEDVAQRWPGFPFADRVLLWIGSEAVSEGKPGDAEWALRAFLARWPTHPEAPRALVLLGDALFLKGEDALALETLGPLATSPDPAWREIARDKSAWIRAEIPRRRWMRVSLAVLVVGAFWFALACPWPRLDPRWLRSASFDACLPLPLFGALTLIGFGKASVLGWTLGTLMLASWPLLFALSLSSQSLGLESSLWGHRRLARMGMASVGALGAAALVLLTYEYHHLGLIGSPMRFNLESGAIEADVSALLWGGAGILVLAAVTVPLLRLPEEGAVRLAARRGAGAARGRKGKGKKRSRGRRAPS